MVAILEQAESEKKRFEKNKHRLEFLALLVGLGLVIERYIQAEYNLILGQLSHIASTNQKLTSAEMGVVRSFVKSGMTKLAREIVNETEAQAAEVARIAAELAGGEYDPTLSAEVLAILNTGALGVPLADVLSLVFLQSMNNVTGAIQRTILGNDSYLVAVKEINLILNNSLRKKVTGEIETQLNKGFNAVAQKVMVAQGVTEMLYHLSPTDTHCPICPPRDGKVYPINDEVWDSLPEHPNCICYGTPFKREEPEQTLSI